MYLDKKNKLEVETILSDTDFLNKAQVRVDECDREDLNNTNSQLLYSRPFSPEGQKKGGISYGAPLIMGFCNLIISFPITKDAKILDVGVGGGWTSEWLSRWGYKVIAGDIGPQSCKIAKKRAISPGNASYKVIQFNAEEMPFENESFDVVLFMRALHHIPDYHKALTESYRVLRKEGWFAAQEPGDPLRINKPENQKLLKESGIVERGFSSVDLKKELSKIGFNPVLLRYHHLSFSPWKWPSQLPGPDLGLRGMALDFFMRFVHVLKIPWDLHKGSFIISARK